jgi:hypothetical protein
LLFIKGAKVAGSSIELFLSQFANELNDDVVTPVYSSMDIHKITNHPMNYLAQDSNVQFFNHIDARNVRLVLGDEYFFQLERFGIVRNPFEKIRSAFSMHYVRRNGDYSVDQAIEETWSEIDKYCDKDGRLLLNNVIKYEELECGLSDIFRTVGIPFTKLSVYEKSEFKKLCVAEFSLNKLQRDKILRKFRWEFENYYCEDE